MTYWHCGNATVFKVPCIWDRFRWVRDRNIVFGVAVVARCAYGNGKILRLCFGIIIACRFSNRNSVFYRCGIIVCYRWNRIGACAGRVFYCASYFGRSLRAGFFCRLYCFWNALFIDFYFKSKRSTFASWKASDIPSIYSVLIVKYRNAARCDVFTIDCCFR